MVAKFTPLAGNDRFVTSGSDFRFLGQLSKSIYCMKGLWYRVNCYITKVRLDNDPSIETVFGSLTIDPAPEIV